MALQSKDRGPRGRELIRLEPLSLIFNQTNRVWEHTRILELPVQNIKRSAIASGWHYVSSYGPFNKFNRPINQGDLPS